MFPFLIKVKNITLDILFPPICLNCQKSIDDRNKLVCEKCLSLIKLNNTLFCPVCRARLAENEQICHFDSQYLLAAAGNYDDPVLQNLIHYFKYKSFKNLAPILGEILLTYLKQLTLFMEAKRMSSQRDQILDSLRLPAVRNVSEAASAWSPSEARRLAAESQAAASRWSEPTAVPSGRQAERPTSLSAWLAVSVPLHPKRERQRGFNQSKLLAEFLAKELNLELVDGLKRIKNTGPQAKIKKPEKRLENISGCFEIKNSEQIGNKNILLIDDVFTSGATINEAIKILKQNDVRKIIVLVIAKA